MVIKPLCSAGIALALCVSASAQSLKAKIDMSAPAPRLPNGKPDFSGLWARPGVQDMTRTTKNANGTSNVGEPNPLPFTPWGQAQWDNYNPTKNGDYAGSCMPFGWIRSFTPHPMQIVQNNEYITFLFEQSTMFQAVNTEGLPHRKDLPPSWFGDSRGRWEGDALVIESVNFNGWAKLGTIGHPMSNQARLTMTFKRPDMGPRRPENLHPVHQQRESFRARAHGRTHGIRVHGGKYLCSDRWRNRAMDRAQRLRYQSRL
jgi:hypothetical protein